MLKLGSCSAGLLFGVSLATLSGCTGSDGGCKSCGRHSGTGPYAASPYPGVSAANQAVTLGAMPARSNETGTMPYGNAPVTPYPTAGYANASGAYPSAAATAMPASASAPTSMSYGNQLTGPYPASGYASLPSAYSVPSAAPAAMAPQTMGEKAAPYGGQKTCPVTGEKLGSMGPAIPVQVKGETVFVCCEGCVAKVQRDPDTYIAKAHAEHGEVFASASATASGDRTTVAGAGGCSKGGCSHCSR